MYRITNGLDNFIRFRLSSIKRMNDSEYTTELRYKKQAIVISLCDNQTTMKEVEELKEKIDVIHNELQLEALITGDNYETN